MLMETGFFKRVIFWALCCLLMGTPALTRAETDAAPETSISLGSTAFKDGGMIPKAHTCDGKDVSPPLAWSGVPEGTKSLAIVCEDPDAPAGIWVHWVLFNMPARGRGLPEGMPPDGILEDGSKQGMNDFHRLGYGGPCPPRGTHRYYFRIYALDKRLDRKPGLTKSQLLRAMKGHILAQGQLMGRYHR